MLLGLVAADSGTARLLDHPVPEALREVVARVGALVETPLFSPNSSGRLNLQLLAEVAGLPRARVEACLETVELRDRADDRFTGYSPGTKQRLGTSRPQRSTRGAAGSRLSTRTSAARSGSASAR